MVGRRSSWRRDHVLMASALPYHYLRRETARYVKLYPNGDSSRHHMLAVSSTTQRAAFFGEAAAWLGHNKASFSAADAERCRLYDDTGWEVNFDDAWPSKLYVAFDGEPFISRHRMPLRFWTALFLGFALLADQALSVVRHDLVAE